MSLDNWINELRNQLKNFDLKTLDSEVKMADVTLGYLDDQGLIHYHKIEYRAKGFEKKYIFYRLKQN
ncbi:MAG: hypothetical protein WC578_01825 [Candidatus Omnitrophota bacterium]